MIDFRPIRLEDRDWIIACRDVARHPFSALSFQSLFTWQREYGLLIGGDSDFFVVKSRQDGGYFAPCGDEEKCRRFLTEAFGREGKQKVLYLTKEQAESAEAEGGYRLRHAPELSEYICSTKALTMQEGYVSYSYRKKCRKFAEEFPYTARRIELEDIPELLGLLGEWEASFQGKERLDLDAIRLSLENFEGLGLEGTIIRTHEGYMAFSLGFSSAPDTYTMAMIKYDQRLSPSVIMPCTCEEARLNAGVLPFCNLEEDLGLQGLRDAKLQCSPIRMQEVYIIEK